MRTFIIVIFFTVGVLVGGGNCQASSNTSKCIDGPFSDVKKAWNAANNQILLHGEYPLIFNESSQQEGFLEPTGLCVPNPDSYKFPSPSSPEIARIIQEGVMKFGQPVPFNATTDPEEYRYIQRILFYFNQHYKSNVSIEVIDTYNSSDAVFAGLARHEIDVVGPEFTIGVFIGDVPRTDLFQAACPIDVERVSVTVSENITAGNWTEFRNVYILDNTTTAAEKPKVAVVAPNFGDFLTAKGIFPGFDVIFFENTDQLTASFENGTVDILWSFAQTDIVDLGINRTTHTFLSDVVTTAGSFFNYDQC